MSLSFCRFLQLSNAADAAGVVLTTGTYDVMYELAGEGGLSDPPMAGDRCDAIVAAMLADPRVLTSDMMRRYREQPQIAYVPPTDAERWAPHLAWLKQEFGGKPFFTADVVALMGDWVPPPWSWDPVYSDPAGLARSLGKAYAKAAGVKGELCLQRAGTRNTVQRWVVAAQPAVDAAVDA